jgi:hypothetical protein
MINYRSILDDFLENAHCLDDAEKIYVKWEESIVENTDCLHNEVITMYNVFLYTTYLAFSDYIEKRIKTE